MTRTEKDRSTVGAVERSVENGTACKTAHASTKNDTTDGAGRQLRIADLLLPGAENAIPRRDLMALTGLSDRELRRQIERERRAGAWIISDNRHGYFLADDPAEVQRFTRSMLHRSAEIAKTARILEGAAGLD